MLAEAFMEVLSDAENPFVQAHAIDTQATGEQRFWEELVQLLRRMTTSARLILTLDDLQWADPTLLRALPYLIRRLANTPLLLLLAYRNEEPTPAFSDLLQRLGHSNRTTWLTLAPLDQQATCAVVQAFKQHNDDSLSIRLYQETKGNPFFLTEILRSLCERGSLTTYEPSDLFKFRKSQDHSYSNMSKQISDYRSGVNTGPIVCANCAKRREIRGNRRRRRSHTNPSWVIKSRSLVARDSGLRSCNQKSRINRWIA
ncbi:MAG: hypothetical protein GFH27_549291n195 [Chloroflexi bacterium AL-W]|nr:hypothetical protein [Chloroflexi bacterium AL-N1]NOK67339.1 hypothetical protein [Chloroflexi bacterium AL-N10]NOK75169.1 hypothetical protein [Chloroflexi bacterium AL-N5]NOK81957.1 hypothetical protein [Chloroflexi bacterium AL-W]NOK89802.1 hypothetical protein [Chloroflexi bacterium AL-N15]